MSEPVCAAALILAAGKGLRAGGELPKQYADLAGAPLLRRTVERFLRYRSPQGRRIAPIAVVINPADKALCCKALGDLADKVLVTSGGATRQESTLKGLLFLNKQMQDAEKIDYIHIHDAARPFLSAALLDKIHAALTPQSGVLPALPVAETLKRADAQGFISATVARHGLYAAQTPQSFPFAAILAAHQAAAAAGRSDYTDDSALAEEHDLRVKYCEGESQNIKITWQKDIIMANRLLEREKDAANSAAGGKAASAAEALPFPDIRTGNGYDVHRLGAGDGVTLCGVKIPCPLALQGHSDADAGLHALTDALLATCGAGDIGAHFPPSDPQWRGAASAIFVRRAAELVRQKGGQIINIDITLICETPKITPHRAAMTAALQSMLGGLAAERISVKATTNEQLGFIGRGEGITAIATAAVFYRS